MAKYKKGKSGNRNGRPKGVQNVVTAEVKEVFADLLRENADNLHKWLQRTAEKNPAKALELVLKLAEFYVAKPHRITISPDEENEPKPFVIEIIRERPPESEKALVEKV